MVKLTTKIAKNADSVGVGAAYGDPVEIEGTTIVPVAFAGYAFASSDEADGQGEAAPAGGGGFSWPVGAYVTRDGYTRFEPNTIALLVVGIPFVCVTARALARVIRALKK